MRDILRRIAEGIVRREEEREKAGKYLREAMGDLILRVEEPITTATVGAVDGSIVADEYGPTILLLLRSVGALFTYENLSLVSVRYVPTPLPDEEPVYNDIPLEREDYHPFKSLHRLSSELTRALEVLDLSPSFFFLDGSIVPQLVDKPHSEALQPLYERVVALFKELYRHYPRTLVAGFVKDSRGNRLGLYLRSQGVDLPNWQDVAWLNYVLQPGEYTYPIPYSEEPEHHPTLKSLDEDAKHIYVFFLRASALDRPYRIEFYSKNPLADARKLASLLYPFSSLNPHYAVPPFLVEVDMRARLSREALSRVRSYIEKIVVARFPSVRLTDRRPL